MRYYTSLIALFYFCLLPIGTKSLGIVMPSTARTRITIGTEAMRLQQADKDRESRANFFLSARTPLKEFNNHSLYGGLFIMSAPDSQSKSRSVDIKQSYLGNFASLSYSYVYLFRYNLTLGGGFLRSTTKSYIQEQSEERSINLGCIFQKMSLDYAFNDWVETSIHTSIYYRYERTLIDWSYGISLNINLK